MKKVLLLNELEDDIDEIEGSTVSGEIITVSLETDASKMVNAPEKPRKRKNLNKDSTLDDDDSEIEDMLWPETLDICRNVRLSTSY